MPKSIYVHIPFCEHICHYCDFNKVFLKGQPVEHYLRALDVEAANSAGKGLGTPIETIYIGGGTPTALTAEQLGKVFRSLDKHFLNQTYVDEYTVEVNPGSADLNKLMMMKAAGVNRLSIGVQSFDQRLLTAIGRTHQKSDIYKTVELARQVGFTNLSLDLMFGLPNQTIEQFQATLDEALTLGVEHFSAYSLKVEEKTVFYNLERKGKLSLPPEEDEVRMYELLIEQMEKHGFNQYEISNFAKRGYESKHNLTYWNNEEYYGLGAGAHGYVNGIRHVNAGPINKYIALIEEKGVPYTEEHIVTMSEKMEEQMFMGLRKVTGISKQAFYARFGTEIEKVFGEPISKLQSQGLLMVDGDNIKLTDRGTMLGNEVFEKFII